MFPQFFLVFLLKSSRADIEGIRDSLEPPSSLLLAPSFFTDQRVCSRKRPNLRGAKFGPGRTQSRQDTHHPINQEFP